MESEATRYRLKEPYNALGYLSLVERNSGQAQTSLLLRLDTAMHELAHRILKLQKDGEVPIWSIFLREIRSKDGDPCGEIITSLTDICCA